ncbi:SLATT domain-containing protein [Mesorhizobium sp. B2-1-5]|uniref:SLATT domain-containing protein n=1 Tax=Mesorhizobium sp. B2-1-5 TaxID=2589969 RepID=UPI001FED45F6|nr:SLATT domain-containing protein [Mesorhizobium sp. B2-1-5]
MWETRGTRFCCHARLTRTNVWITYAIATGSAYVIFLSMLGVLNLHAFSAEDYKIINIGSVFISVVIIFLSLIEGAKNYTLRAEAMHQCAREITAVYHRAEAKIKNVPGCALADISAEVVAYDAVVDKYHFNHDRLDFLIFRAENPKVYKCGYPMIGGVWLLRVVCTYGAFAFVLVSVPAFLAAIVLVVNRY